MAHQHEIDYIKQEFNSHQPIEYKISVILRYSSRKNKQTIE